MAKHGSGVARRVAHAGGRKPRGGFKPFHLHVTEPEGGKALRILRRERRRLPAFALHSTEAAVLNSETAAIEILQQALDSATLPDFTPPKIGETESSFKSLGVETVPLTGTKFVKFRQHVKGIPVYGSLVVVELDEAYECVSIDANLATPEDCGRLAKVSPFEASRAVAEEAGYGEEEPPATPVLSYSSRAGRQVASRLHARGRAAAASTRAPVGAHRHSSLVFDYVVDTMSGAVIAELPRTPTLTVREERAPDACGLPRRIRVTEVPDLQAPARSGTQRRDLRLRVPGLPRRAREAAGDGSARCLEARRRQRPRERYRSGQVPAPGAQAQRHRQPRRPAHLGRQLHRQRRRAGRAGLAQRLLGRHPNDLWPGAVQAQAALLRRGPGHRRARALPRGDRVHGPARVRGRDRRSQRYPIRTSSPS